MRTVKTVKKAVRRWCERAGYPILPRWRLSRYSQSTHLAQLFAQLGIDCVLDVGANVGQFREFLRLHVGYPGHIVSFEPVGDLYARLLEASRSDPHWTVHQYALGEAETTAEINVLQEQTLTSLLVPDETSIRAMGYEKYLRETTLLRTEPVAVRRLDAVLPQILPFPDARVFLKSDTQGYDMNVVRGAAGCLDRIAALQVELSVRRIYQGAPAYMDAIAELNACGFEATGFYPVQRDRAQRLVNIDCVMIRGEEAERLVRGTAVREPRPS